jgi:hypothetical protein
MCLSEYCLVIDIMFVFRTCRMKSVTELSRLQRELIGVRLASTALTNQRANKEADSDITKPHPCKSGVAQQRRAFQRANSSLPISSKISSNTDRLSAIFPLYLVDRLSCTFTTFPSQPHIHNIPILIMACPVIGTTTDVLPPNHPSVDLSKDGQTVCTP